MIRHRDSAVQLVIEGPDPEVNAHTFESLKSDREAIEVEFGAQLDWDRIEGRKRGFIGVTIPGGGYRDDEERWPETQRRMIETTLSLERTFRPRIQMVRF